MRPIFTAGPRSTTKLLMKADADVKGRTPQEESQDGKRPEAENDKGSHEGYDKEAETARSP